MLIDFCQFLYDLGPKGPRYDSVEKVLFKVDLFIYFFFLHDRNAKANASTQSEYTVHIICSRI